jgi:hypothetical protein
MYQFFARRARGTTGIARRGAVVVGSGLLLASLAAFTVGAQSASAGIPSDHRAELIDRNVQIGDCRAGGVQIPIEAIHFTLNPAGTHLTITSVDSPYTVGSIFVKGGNDTNLYVPGLRDLPAAPPWSDLISPLVGKDEIPQISHWFACTGTPNTTTTTTVAPTTTTTVAPTTTTTDAPTTTTTVAPTTTTTVAPTTTTTVAPTTTTTTCPDCVPNTQGVTSTTLPPTTTTSTTVGSATSSLPPTTVAPTTATTLVLAAQATAAPATTTTAAASSQATDRLPTTGGDSALLWFGLAAAGAGVTLIAGSRRRADN